MYYYYWPQPQWQPQPLPPPLVRRHRGLALAAMICGLVALCLFFIWPMAAALGVAGIILSVGALKLRTTSKTFAVAGLVTSIIGLLLAMLTPFVWAALTASLNDFFNGNYTGGHVFTV
ncbi:MAG: hypothetical protein FWF49_01970 [Oscillospiraceae bacterium]|nr:hypothetical protein [Oscillospiraceae bacterium]